jgi:Fe-S cluster assembly ATP-binding protein
MLELKNITFKSENKTIIDDISLTVNDGEILLFTGPNGGGKTTLAKIIMGLVVPTSGKIILDGEDITNMSVTDRAKKGIGYAFQTPPRFKGLTVKKMLSIACGENFSEECCCDLLSKVGLCQKEYLNRTLDTSLSGGELKRIEVATILARELKISIYDEPEAGIDLWSFNNLIKVFEKMHEKTHGNILIISHQERILDIADKIIVIADGKIAAYGTKDEILPELLSAQAACKYASGGEE